MKTILNLNLLILVSLFAAQVSFAQKFNYDRYKLRTLSELVEINSSTPIDDSAKKHILISGDWFHSRVRLKYIGTSKPISPTGNEILRAWQKSFKIPEKTVKLFEREFLFKECERDFWLPVQKQISEHFSKELEPGDMVTIYLFFAGGIKTKGKW